MSNYMTLEELHQKLGKWIKDNPETKNSLVVGATVNGEYVCKVGDDDIPGTVLIGLSENCIDDTEKIGTLALIPPIINKYVM